MLRRILILIFALQLLTVFPVFAAPSLDVSLSKQKIASDETTDLVIQIKWPKSEGTYLLAMPEVPLENLAITNHAESLETFVNQDAEWTRKIFTIQLTPKKAGAGKVESFNITYIQSASQEKGAFNVSPMEVSVSKSFHPERIFSGTFALAAGGALILIAAATAILILAKRRKAALNKPRQPTSQELSAAAIKKSIESQTFYAQNSVSDLNHELRRFLTECYSFDALKCSESEILATLKSQGIPSDETERLKKILDTFNEIKFMRTQINDDDFKMLKKSLLEYINGKTVLEITP